nr:ATP-binding cassette domain-containing protein [Dendrosporobacter quercicolus]
MDEPSANLDDAGTEQLAAILKTLKAQGHTIIIAEHRLSYLKGSADRVVLLEGGLWKEEYSANSFFTKPAQWLRNKGFRGLDRPVLRPGIKETGSAVKAPFLEAVDISFGYNRGTPVLNDISLQADRGEVIGIMGTNGAGKSTLLRVLMGLEKPAKGKILIDGVPAGSRTRRRQSFYVMQDVDYQLFAPSVWEELLLGSKASADMVNKAEEYLRFFQLDCVKSAHPAALSGGQKQRLAIAVACMRNAGLLFLDEPTSGLDGENMAKVSGMIKKLARDGRCIFVITHDTEFAAATFDQIYHLSEHGRLSDRHLPELYKYEEREELP